jgi:hypothetical protein
VLGAQGCCINTPVGTPPLQTAPKNYPAVALLPHILTKPILYLALHIHFGFGLEPIVHNALIVKGTIKATVV